MARSLHVLIAGGSGMIGTALTTELRAQGHTVRYLARAGSPLIDNTWCFAWRPGVTEVNLDELEEATGAPFDAVINLAGSTISKMPWTKKTKHVILSSRLNATATLVDAINQACHKPEVLLNGSAVGFYGDRGSEVLTESSPRGSGFLADVVASWEHATEHLDPQVRLVFARTGLVLGSQGALGPLRLLTRFFVAGPLAGGKDWWPWISLRDEARALVFLLDNKISGPVNLVGPQPATSGMVMKAVAKAMKRPFWLPAPGFAIKILLGQAGKELLLSSQKISPDVLLTSGFTFLDADVTEGVHSALR
ncbi:uncharacterized protein (TIGR01777 family) [Aurantimicrobium minutum]|uniref:TIGR01777 family oxidoreductase n=1 Tax=Aurantimicrobium minutum TaxID=708131 RepID=UPI002473C3D5|nr:TIGR01777 family oxidoreductase [Aurantimicrobium minutum]MDH6533171.1 uncharacterized protein (TIGR01777 family) [Aurantimicrobium minutum]